MPQSIHPETSLGQIRLKVGDLDRSIRFYREVIGFGLLDRSGNTADLTVDGRRTFLVLEEIPDAAAIPRRRATSGLYHFAILVPDRERLGLSLRNLIRFGIQVGQGDHLVSEALYLSDPDNNGIEIYRDRPRSEWRKDAAGNYVMGTEPVDIQGLLQASENATWNRLSPDTVLGHIHLHVADLAVARAYYCDTLGFDLVADASKMGALFVSAGGYHHHIGLNIWAGVGAPPAPANAAGLAYYTIAVPTGDELVRIAGKLNEAGYPVVREKDALIATDPFGIEIRWIVGG